MIRSDPELRIIRDRVARVGRLSDSLVRLGRFRLGLDGILAWAPGVGQIYSTVAGGFIVIQGARAGVPLPTLAVAVALLGLRTTVSAVPIAGAAFADLFTAHRWAAGLVIRDIERRMAAGTDRSQALAGAIPARA